MRSGSQSDLSAADVELYDIGDGILAARMPSGSAVRHEEHKVVVLPAGEKAIGPTQEYDHFLEEAREVVD